MSDNVHFDEAKGRTTLEFSVLAFEGEGNLLMDMKNISHYPSWACIFRKQAWRRWDWLAWRCKKRRGCTAGCQVASRERLRDTAYLYKPSFPLHDVRCVVLTLVLLLWLEYANNGSVHDEKLNWKGIGVTVCLWRVSVGTGTKNVDEVRKLTLQSRYPKQNALDSFTLNMSSGLF